MSDHTTLPRDGVTLTCRFVDRFFLRGRVGTLGQ